MLRNKTIIIICEGASEQAYLSELSKALREEGIPINLCPKSQNGGGYKTSIQMYKILKSKERNSKNISPVIWVDKDTYTHNDSKNKKAYLEKPSYIPNFHFNYYNFEDMLILHCSSEIIQKWENVCKDNGHFINPMKSSQYIPLYKQHIFSNYEKGTLPIDINLKTLRKAIQNNNDQNIKLKSDFLTFLEETLQEYL